MSSAYLKLWIFLLAILIPACASSSLSFHMMYSAYKLNKQGDNIQPWCSPFPVWTRSSEFEYRITELQPKVDRNTYESISSVQFSRSVMSDSLWPRGLQHTRPPCPSPTPRVHSNSCPLSRWCHPTISSSVSPSAPALNLSQHQDLFQWVSSSHEVARYWSFNFNISPSNEHPRLISFRMDWLDLLEVQGTHKSLRQHHT